MWPAIAAMAAAGLLKSELVDAPKAERQRKLAAETAKYSPWTGMTPGQVQEADPFGSMLQGAGTGAMFGQMGEAGDLAKRELALKEAAAAPSAANSLAPSSMMGAPVVPSNSYPMMRPDMRFNSWRM